MTAIHDVTDDSFQRDVIESKVPVLVDFWGDHCPACKQISPILDELATERTGSLKVVKIHAAENARTSQQFGVRAMPTVLVFQNGMVKGQITGARPKSAFESLIEQAN